WEAQNKALAGLSNKAAILVGDLAAVTKESQAAANTKPIEIKTTATTTGSKSKGGASAAQKEADQYAKAQETVNQKLDELRQKAELSAGSVGELSRAQAVLNAQQSLGNAATQEQLMLAGQLAGKAWDNANALREQAKAERERTEAANKFSTIQGKTSKTAGLDSQYQKDIADIQLYAQIYPQKIGEAEAARAAIEQQYRDQRNAAMWEEWAQQNAATQAAAAAFDSLGSVASNALTGIVTGSMSASDAMRSIGMTVLNSVVNSFVQMGIEWVKSAIMGQTATTAAVAASTTAQAAGIATTTATSTAAAAATTAAWTPAAIMSSVASFGGAVAIGLGAMAGILALSGKRKNGGPVSAGGMYQVGEGGMPEIYQASTGKQYMIPGDNGRVISNKEMTAGGGGVVINIQNYTSSSVDAQAGTDANGGLTVDVIVADLNNGGPISSGITSNFNVKRTPRGQG
ncbi:tape measure protein, partial [Enterobacter hormaechei subsp. steigerwaltii]